MQRSLRPQPKIFQFSTFPETDDNTIDFQKKGAPSKFRNYSVSARYVTNKELESIVKRLTRPTVSTSIKSLPLLRDKTYVDINSYTWNNMRLYTDYKQTVWTDKGSARCNRRRWNKDILLFICQTGGRSQCFSVGWTSTYLFRTS